MQHIPGEVVFLLHSIPYMQPDLSVMEHRTALVNPRLCVAPSAHRYALLRWRGRTGRRGNFKATA